MPAIFRDTWVPGAKLFYTLDALGELQRLNSDVFDAIHVENKDLNDEQSLANWVVSKGVDRKKFLDTFNSFNVQTKAKRAEQLTRQSKIQGVPALIIDGRYATSGAMVGGHEQMLAVADELIQKARGERKKK
jgi:thiol:disulfide interchange protein DsbA